MLHKYTHAIMFHHFHNEIHSPAQGSISSIDLSKMLDWLNRKYNVIGAREYIDKFEKKL